MLKSLVSIQEEIIHAKQGHDGSLWNILKGDGDLVVSPREIHFGKGGCTGQGSSEVQDMGQRVPIWGRKHFETAVIPTGLPCTLQLQHHMAR